MSDPEEAERRVMRQSFPRRQRRKAIDRIEPFDRERMTAAGLCAFSSAELIDAANRLSTLADEVCLLDRAVYEAWQAASWDSTKKRFANWHRPIRKAWKETITLAGLLRDLATFGQVRMTKGKQ